MVLKIRNWALSIPALKETIARFPLPIICALCASFVLMLLIHKIHPFTQVTLGKIVATMLYGVVAFTSLILFLERKKGSVVHYVMGAVVITMMIIVFVWQVFDERVSMTFFLFSISIVLSILFAPYIRNTTNSSSVWYFNYQTGVAVFFGGVAAIILGSGISLSLASIAYLFGIDIPGQLYGDVWVLCWGVLFPIYVLANISKEFEFQEENCQFPKGVSFITNYILVPLMTAYMAILYVYFIKIIVQWELPRGNLGWMISSFGTIGITTKLLVFPIRNSGTRLLVLFDRFFYYALIVPCILLFLAIGIRISEYGVTEERYTVVLLGVWFMIVSVTAIVSRDRFHIKYAPMILAVMALLASFGPWGAVEISISNQVGRFESLLKKHQLLVNGLAVKTTGEIPFADRQSLSSIADYMSATERRLSRVRPWFSNLLAEAGDKSLEVSNWGVGKQIIELMGVTYVKRWEREQQRKSIEYKLEDKSALLLSTGFDYVGRGVLYSNEGRTKTDFILNFYRNGQVESVNLQFDGKTVRVLGNSNEKIEMDFEVLLLNLRKLNYSSISLEEQNKMTLTGSSTGGALKARMVITNIYGTESENGYIIYSLDYILMLKIDR